jgi:hypothetical protein
MTAGAVLAAVVLAWAAPAAAMHLGSKRPADLPAGPAAGSGAVLVIGDSLQVGSAPYLQRALPQLSFTVDAESGRTSSEGLAILRERLSQAHGVVVFDLGVNNSPSAPGVLAADLEALRGLAGDRCLVLATLSRPSLGGASVAAGNAVIRSFAAASPQVRLVEWREATLGSPGLLMGDGVHGTAQGYAVRGRLVAQAVESCFAPSPTAAGGSAAEHHGPSEAQLERRRARRLAAARARRARIAQERVKAQAAQVLRSVGAWIP